VEEEKRLDNLEKRSSPQEGLKTITRRGLATSSLEGHLLRKVGGQGGRGKALAAREGGKRRRKGFGAGGRISPKAIAKNTKPALGCSPSLPNSERLTRRSLKNPVPLCQRLRS